MVRLRQAEPVDLTHALACAAQAETPAAPKPAQIDKNGVLILIRTTLIAIGDPNNLNGNNSFITGDNNNVNATIANPFGVAGNGDNINVAGSGNTVAGVRPREYL